MRFFAILLVAVPLVEAFAYPKDNGSPLALRNEKASGAPTTPTYANPPQATETVAGIITQPKTWFRVSLAEHVDGGGHINGGQECHANMTVCTSLEKYIHSSLPQIKDTHKRSPKFNGASFIELTTCPSFTGPDGYREYHCYLWDNYNCEQTNTPFVVGGKVQGNLLEAGWNDRVKSYQCAWNN
ncbi:hypothetical protein CC86DRAFT_385150 [Ophiobolus disseminans]|uniref:Uncharacterized protein n=1 Tax=Ophiobolus disseminans TaxID=1469910 RepID=A0A6A6ZRM2_9PLEO|nr:hypothetical protein CC86DRAFT_385150 [Ophiobolus disseminans]